MADESCEIGETPAQSRYAAEWGLATILLAAFVAMTALILALFYPWVDRVRQARGLLPIDHYVIGGLTFLFWCASVVAILFGRHGIRAAWARCQPGGLPLAGTVLAILAFFLWSAIGGTMVFLWFHARLVPIP